MTKELSFAELQQKANKRHEEVLARLRDRYNYARQLGFTVSEAQILSRKPKEVIDTVELDRKGKKIHRI